jgi:cytosine/uracil/thiamine/allantoin permease
MSTVSHEPSTVVRRPTWIDARDMWASMTIVAIWLAVAVSAAFAPDFQSIDVAGNHTTIPSVIITALFAMFATMSVAKDGFDRNERTRKA